MRMEDATKLKMHRLKTPVSEILHHTSRKLAMINTILSKRFGCSLGICSASYRLYHAGKGGSVNTAIARGLRKSKGMGFRGKAVKDPDDPREKYRSRHGIDAYSPPQFDRDTRVGNYKAGRDKSSSKADDARSSSHIGRLEQGPERRGRFGELIKGGTLRKVEYKEKPGRGRDGKYNTSVSGAGAWPTQRQWVTTGKRESRSPSRRDATEEGSSRRSGGRGASQSATSWDQEGRRELFKRQEDSRSKGSRADSRKHSLSSSPLPENRGWERPSESPRLRDRSSSAGDRLSSYSAPKFPLSRNEHSVDIDDHRRGALQKSFEASRVGRGGNRNDRYSASEERDHKGSSEVKPRFTQTIDNRIPVSIPYTTPASEFLYGTSVVEAALSSRRVPRRKLYKLYIYSGADREDASRDVGIIKLAQKNRVDVVQVDKAGVRMMDKMSGGRPHNGYVLEASPLPRLPVTSLGEVTSEDGYHGFGVSVDHQSREEAAVNGTENFIHTPPGRKPLVLLLDSIVDPGNLGGIIRTAAFLGVSAVAISTRNSASFTPIVLKASAGASENVTLFGVKKPAGFVVDSQANGWKVFAAVAPSEEHRPDVEYMSTDELIDPLSEAPCILMLGSEGEGLRWNLRSKADVELCIQGSDGSHNVDSLNVSVAAGILCSSFLNSRRAAKTLTQAIQLPEPAPEMPNERLF